MKSCKRTIPLIFGYLHILQTIKSYFYTVSFIGIDPDSLHYHIDYKILTGGYLYDNVQIKKSLLYINYNHMKL